MPAPRRPRADAARNRQRILAAAREQIAAAGPGVGMDEIAAAAGVAVGTLYRHFPNKTDLVSAVVADYVALVADDAEAAARRAAEGARAVEELTGFLRRIVGSAGTDLAVKSVAVGLGASVHDGGDAERATRAIEGLIAAATRAGDLAPDVTLDDIGLIVTTAPTELPAPGRERWLSLMFAGLRSRT